MQRGDQRCGGHSLVHRQRLIADVEQWRAVSLDEVGVVPAVDEGGDVDQTLEEFEVRGQPADVVFAQGAPQAAAVLDEPRYLVAAQRAARFVLDHMRRDDGRLLHGWRLGQARLDAYLDDYAYLTNALISLLSRVIRVWGRTAPGKSVRMAQSMVLGRKESRAA